MTTENQDLENTPSETTENGNSGGMKKIVAAVAAVAIVGGGLAISSSVDATAEKKVTEFVDEVNENMASEKVKFEFGSVDASLMSSSVSVNDITIKDTADNEDAIKADGVTIQAKGYVEDERLPHVMSLSLDNMQLVDTNTLKRLKRDTGMDYKDRSINSSFSYEIDQKEGTLNVNSDLSISGLNKMSVDLDVVGVSDVWTALQDGYKANKGDFNAFSYEERKAMEKGMRDVKFKSFDLTYENKGEIEKMMEYAAAENGITVKRLKEQMPVMIDHYLGETEMAAEIKEFIANPGKLSLKMNPKEPVNFQELTMMSMAAMMGRTDQVVEKLNLTVEAN